MGELGEGQPRREVRWEPDEVPRIRCVRVHLRWTRRSHRHPFLLPPLRALLALHSTSLDGHNRLFRLV